MAFYPSGGLFTTLAGGTIPGALTLTGLLTTQAGIANSGAAISSASQNFSGTGVAGAVLPGGVDVNLAGVGLKVAEGSNAKQGTATLVAGTVTVANTSVTATSRIFLTGQVLGGTAGALNVTSRIAGTSFTVTSTNAADTSTFAYEIFEVG